MTGAPRSEQFDDVYFSAHDGPGETAHVFFDGNGLADRWQGPELLGSRRFAIGETGFGTGLNFVLAWELFDRIAPKDAFLDFVSVEKFPLTAAQIREGLSPWAARLEPYLSKMLGQYPMRIPGFHRIVFDGRVALTLVFDDANDALPEVVGQVDAWFLDGFTPSKNPDMWTDGLFTEMARLSHDKTTFATFTAAGFVKRGLQGAGFAVEKRKGFGPKRDMLAGHFTGATKRRDKKPESIAIHGAGLSGTAAHFVLKQYGIDSTIYDPNDVAGGASGNVVGLINPRFTAFRDASSDFYASGFALARRTFPALGAEYDACGALHMVTDVDKEKRFTRTAENWGWQDGEMQYIDAAAASNIAGVKIDHAALYLLSSARISPAGLCRAYLQDTPVLTTPRDSDITILANGIAALDHPALSGLPIHTVRGQITEVTTTPTSSALKANLHYGGYLSAPTDGRHAVGSTFQKWLTDTDIRPEDDTDNLAKLAAAVPAIGPLAVTGHRAAMRTASKDRFPVIGAAAENIYVSTAHGSHGIVSTLLGAHILADAIRGGIFCVGKTTLNALTPWRFFGGAQ